MVIRANWKMPLENAVDDYHAGFVHRGVWDLDEHLDAVWRSTERPDSPAVGIDLGGGHTDMEFGTGVRVVGGGVAGESICDDVRRDYERQIVERLGPDAAKIVLTHAVPHMMVFPNLFMLQNDLRIIVPISVNKTFYYHYFFDLDGAHPDINRMRRRHHEVSYGPAGMVLQDDIEVFERNQDGLESRIGGPEEWLDLSRGMHRETVNDAGFRVGKTKDEIMQRAIWRHYLARMTDTGTVSAEARS